MKKLFLILSSLGVLLTLNFVLSSCGGDDPKASKAKVSFSTATKTVQESAGTIEVKVVLDKPVTADVIVSYDLSGTATQKAGITAGDYEIDGDAGEVTIPKGETIGTLSIKIIDDEIFEIDETIEITLSDVSGNLATISDDNQMEVTIQSDDVAPKASFALTTLTVNEADGLEGYLNVQINLDKAAPMDMDIEYELTGTAIDSTYGFNNDAPSEYYDYYIHGESGKVTVNSGESSTNIVIQLLSDFHYEPTNETIIITLKESSSIQLGTNKTMTITLKQQNGKVVALLWDNDAYTNVDMDMFLWIGNDVNSLNGIIGSSLNPSVTVKQELVFVPEGVISNAGLGLSFVYYEGTANPLDFEVQFADYTDGVLEALANRDVFEGSYTTANINKWDTNGAPNPQVEQTFEIVDGTLTNISDISTPNSGSRARSYKIPSKAVRTKLAKSTLDF
jgi:hypothetical protein